jgi:hypothetical protein
MTRTVNSAVLSKFSDEYEQKLRDLAQDIVKNIYEIPDILQRAGITQNEYAALAETTPFKQMLQVAANEWDGAHNTSLRVKLKSALLLEQALPSMFGALIDKEEPLAARTQLFVAMGKVGELGHAPPITQGANAGSTFRLEINFPSQPAKSIVIQHDELPSEVSPGQMPPSGEFSDNVAELDALSRSENGQS